MAAVNCHIETVKVLLAMGADIEAKDEDGDTPLVETLALSAIKSGDRDHEGTVRILLENGANAKAKTTSHYTPLHFVAHTGSVGIAECLLQHQADINAQNHDGDTLLHLTIAAGRQIVSYNNVHQEITDNQFAWLNLAKFLLQRGADAKYPPNNPIFSAVN